MVGLDPETIKLGIWILGAGVLILAAVLLVRYLWRRRSRKTAVDVVAELPPFEAAVRTLDRLGLDPGNNAKAFYFDLGHTLKAYLGGTFELNCLEMTTPELTRSLRPLAMPDRLKKEVAAFQDLCDPFRYAPLAGDLVPDRRRQSADLATARELISAVETDVQNRQRQVETAEKTEAGA